MRATASRFRRPVPAAIVTVEPTAGTRARWSAEWWYFSAIVVAWCFTPFVRRLIDYHNGAFNPVQITSLVPYLALLPLVGLCFRRERLARLPKAFRILCWIWLATFCYGFLIAFAVGNISAAGFEFVEFLVPMLAGLWIAGQELPAAQAFRRFATVVLACASIAAVYGIAQWIQPPPWDVMWVIGNDFVTVDAPEPFSMRIFSTLNSPGTAGDYFALCMLLVMPWLRLRSVWVWPLLSILGAALLLTLVREAWVALVIGLVAFLVASPRRRATAPLLGLYAALMIVLAIAVPPLLGSRNSDVITSRVATLTDVGHDTSALDRQAEISDALDQGLGNPIGSGLGVFGSASKLGPNPVLTVGNILDSGYLARLIELGWAGEIAFLIVTIGGPAALAFALFKPGGTVSIDDRVAGAVMIAVSIALAWGEAADDAHDGLDGFFFWVVLGIVALAIRAVPGSVPAFRKSSVRVGQ